MKCKVKCKHATCIGIFTVHCKKLGKTVKLDKKCEKKLKDTDEIVIKYNDLKNNLNL